MIWNFFFIPTNLKSADYSRRISFPIYQFVFLIIINVAVFTLLIEIIDPAAYYFHDLVNNLRLNNVFKLSLPDNWIITVFRILKYSIYLLLILRILDILSANLIILYINRIKNELIIDVFPYFISKKRYYIDLKKKRFIIHQNIFEQFLNECRLELLDL